MTDRSGVAAGFAVPPPGVTPLRLLIASERANEVNAVLSALAAPGLYYTYESTASLTAARSLSNNGNYDALLWVEREQLLSAPDELLSVLRNLRQVVPELPVVLVTDLLDAGVTCQRHELEVMGVVCVCGSLASLPQVLSNLVSSSPAARAARGTPNLTEPLAESQVLGLLLAGESMEAILAALVELQERIPKGRAELLQLQELTGWQVEAGGEEHSPLLAVVADHAAVLAAGEAIALRQSESPKSAAVLAFWSKSKMRSLLLVPVIACGQLLGAIGMQCDRDVPWGRSERTAVRQAATYCALGLEQMRTCERLRHLEQDVCAARADLHARSEMLATMSHDLRTPLASILGFAGMLKQQIYGRLNLKQLEYVQLLFDCGEYLLALIEDLLDLSKIDVGREDLTLETVCIREVCEASLSLVHEAARVRGLELQLEIATDAIACVADRRRLQQILVNLLANAVKFTEVGMVQLRVERANNCIAFATIDTGIGIKPEDLDKLFQPFQQIDSPLNRKQRGTGLGLVLSQKLAQLHDGEIFVESEFGCGSCFTLKLPIRTLEAE
ncbi:signal transduction histidine kinase [Rubidibacter lacunae KORDI 51-2]|uniref:Circadian input-output histidine kinase CikA n=1 Tax=Rubidibacter lacunae KORDI 51-2 TaxID=582515 RepID=U5DDN2_9CHRO|nr:ATP-binding protein [Rubidibacter lacunae]ERN42613.1 signal transduction histidine kinase [Rubidibacter lacunae KORDI 51-2]